MKTFMKTFLILLKKLFSIEDIFTIAIRDISNDTSLYSNNKPLTFKALRYDKNFWFADPFLWEKDGRTYVFFENFNRKTLLGNIACSEILPDLSYSSPQVVLEDHFHFSFPYLFEYAGVLYMLPETGATKTLRIYKCKSFPLEWEIHSIIDIDKDLADSIILTYNENNYVFTNIWDNKEPLKCKCTLFKLLLDDQAKFYVKQHDIDISALSNFSYANRNAGNFVIDNGRIFRPVQISEPFDYGCGLKFCQVSCWNESKYEEKEYCTLKNQNIRIHDFKKRIRGVHTYNRTDKYEIIDIKFNVFNFYKWLRRLKKLIKS